MAGSRKINFANCDVLGFDMDYTLSRYKFVPFFNMVYEGVCTFLVEHKNYSSSIFHGLNEDKDLIYKGLIVDFQKGNVLKLGHDGIILRATHGTKTLSQREIETVYKDKKFADYESFKQGMKSADGKWRFFENYFDIPGLVAFSKIIDYFREQNMYESSSTYEHVWADVLAALEDMYSPSHFADCRGHFFKHMTKDMNKYATPASQQVKDWLRALRMNNRKLFLLTSSYPDFAAHVMNFILGSDWRSYFDLILTGGRKPRFFTESKPFIEVKNQKLGQEVKRLRTGGEYCHGNYSDLMVFLREVTKKQDPTVIYFGDNLWADAWPSKTLGGWKSVLVLEEMDAEGYVVSDGTVPGHEIVIDDASKPLSKQKIKYEHSSLVTAEEMELMVSDFWGSIFLDENSTASEILPPSRFSLEARQMNTAFGDLISQYSDICVPSIEYLSGVPVDHNFTAFSEDFGNSNGFHPGCPRSLLP
ncbi:hypothetical protein BsWGS_13065 [Bradybaena similaris]